MNSEFIEKICDKYNNIIENYSEEDKESNQIYGAIFSILSKEPNTDLYRLIAIINSNKTKFEKNKIRNRRERIKGVHKSLESANLIFNKLYDCDLKSLEEVEQILKTPDIFRNRMVLSLLLEENFSEEFYDVYYNIKNDQCKGFISSLVELLKEKNNLFNVFHQNKSNI